MDSISSRISDGVPSRYVEQTGSHTLSTALEQVLKRDSQSSQFSVGETDSVASIAKSSLTSENNDLQLVEEEGKADDLNNIIVIDPKSSWVESGQQRTFW